MDQHCMKEIEASDSSLNDTNDMSTGDDQSDLSNFLSVEMLNDGGENVGVKNGLDTLVGSSAEKTKNQSENEHNCHLCGMGFTKSSHLKRHLATHTGERNFVCKICKKSFSRKDVLTRHELGHKGIQLNLEKTTISKEALMQNRGEETCIRVPPAEESKPSVCIMDGVSYRENQQLEEPINANHQTDKTHECTLCQQRFASSTSLKRHILTHTGAKPFGCTLCERHFGRRSHLKRHMREVHNTDMPEEVPTVVDELKSYEVPTGLKDRPWGCAECGVNYKIRWHLRHHYKTCHSVDARPHGCQFCEKRFFFPCELNRHLRTHTGLKLYSCDICLKKFNQSWHLNQHILKIHGKDKKEKTEKTTDQKGFDINEEEDFTCVPFVECDVQIEDRI